jgi:hypothetical protein
MNQQGVTVNRSLVGAIALVLLAAAGLLTMTGADEQGLWSGACLKVGLVMAAFWLAHPSFTRNPELGRTSLTALVAAIAAALIIARTRAPLKIIVPVLAVTVIAIRVLRPRQHRPTRPPRVD